jgi:hypothetical protein
MKRVSVLTRVLDRLLLTEAPPQPSYLAKAAPMSDGELARAMRELQRTSTVASATELRASVRAQARRLRRSANEGARTVARTQELVGNAAGLLRDPAPDTFLGRKTREPFPGEADEE